MKLLASAIQILQEKDPQNVVLTLSVETVRDDNGNDWWIGHVINRRVPDGEEGRVWASSVGMRYLDECLTELGECLVQKHPLDS